MLVRFFLFLFLGIVSVSLGCYSTSRRAGTFENGSREVRLTYVFSVKDIPPNSSKITIWTPIPGSDSRQKVKDFKVTCLYPYTLYTEPEYGNRILKVEAAGKLPEKIEVKLEYTVQRSADKMPEGKRAEMLDEESLKRYLSADRLVPIDGRIAEGARKVVRKDMAPLQKARAIYNYVVETMKYDKSGQGWGRGDALYACDARKGNCTDFHSLFIGMARASGIPARFIMGLPLPTGSNNGEIPSYHCWAEFYVKGLGWIPVDASEACKHPEKKEFFFGGLDENRVAFTLGRDIRIDPAVEPLNYLIYPYVVVDGEAYAKVDWKIGFENSVN